MIGKTFVFPLWLEAMAVIGMAVMAVVEARHGQWLWAMIFGIGSLAFICSGVARVFSGENHDQS